MMSAGVMIMDRSLSSISVGSVLVLTVGPFWPIWTEAVFSTVVSAPETTLTVIVTSPVAPGCTSFSVQVTIPDSLFNAPSLSADTNSVPVGTLSVMVTVASVSSVFL